MFMLGLQVTLFVCVCVCVCVDYICILLYVVVYVIVNMYVCMMIPNQKCGLPIGNQLSGVLVCQFLEFLESNPFKYRLSSNTTYLRYIDDILIFLPQNIKIEEIAEKLNNVEPSINFTYEKESNNTIPFLDILIIKSHNILTSKVYHKPTNKNDYIHFYSHHNNKIKTGLIIGFYVRALRICSPEYLDEEFEYIEHSLKRLKYLKIFHIKC